MLSTVGFGLLDSAPGLDIARFVEGVGGACSWAGGLAWIVAATPPERRGAVMGTALGTAIGGSLFGPPIGALASAVGRPALFCAAGGRTRRCCSSRSASCPDRRGTSDQPVADVLRVLHRPALAGAMWLMVLPAIVSGVFNVLGPLRLHRLGAGAGVIGATFLAGAGLEAADLARRRALLRSPRPHAAAARRHWLRSRSAWAASRCPPQRWHWGC